MQVKVAFYPGGKKSIELFPAATKWVELLN